MRARLTYGRGPRLVAAFFLAVLSVATVLAIVRPGAGNGSHGSERTVSSVYGFNHAETASWESPTTLGFLAAGIALLAAFAAIQRRVAHPAAAPTVVLDRNRGGSYLAVGIVGIGIFGAFFLLTY